MNPSNKFTADVDRKPETRTLKRSRTVTTSSCHSASPSVEHRVPAARTTESDVGNSNEPDEPTDPPLVHQELPKKATENLGAAHIICGVIIVASDAVLTSKVESEWLCLSPTNGGSGIWCGAFMIVTGVLACYSASWKTDALVKSHLIFSVISGFLLCPLTIGAAGSLHQSDLVLYMNLIQLIFSCFELFICLWTVVLTLEAMRKSQMLLQPNSEAMSADTVRRLGVMNLVCGLLLVSLLLFASFKGIVLEHLMMYGTGFWCSCFVIVSGGLGCLAAAPEVACVKKSFVVASVVPGVIISALLVGVASRDFPSSFSRCHMKIGGSVSSIGLNVLVLFWSLVALAVHLWIVRVSVLHFWPRATATTTSCTTCSGSSAPATQLPVAKPTDVTTSRFLQELIEEKLCDICSDNVKDVAFGCGHLVCSSCAVKLKDCHICRHKIQIQTRLYF